jgi:hypothetical protein
MEHIFVILFIMMNGRQNLGDNLEHFSRFKLLHLGLTFLK